MKNYKISKLKNGLKLITVPMRGTKTITVLVIVGTGSKYEDKNISGISHFLEHMFFKGTEKRPTAMAIASELDSIGAEFNAFTGKEYTGYWVKAEATKIKIAMDVVSDMLLNSLFEQVEIDREKGVIIEELNMYQDNPIMHIEDVFEQCLYGDTPAGWDTIGTAKTINSVQRNDFIKYLNSQYNTENTTICFVGNIGKTEKAKNLVDKYFSSKIFKERGENFSEKKKVIEKQIRPAIKVHYKKTDQAHLSLGCRTHGYEYKDKIILKIISIILGGSMSSRLFINLRERNGLAYYVRTESEIYTDTGYLTTRAGVPVDKLDKAINIILDEYKKIKTELVGIDELDRIKDMILGRMAIQIESSETQANWYARQAVMWDTLKRKDKKIDLNRKISSPEEYFKLIQNIKAQDIKKVATKIFVNKGLNLALIGPFRDKSKVLKKVKFN